MRGARSRKEQNKRMNGGIGLKNIFGEEAWALLRTSLRFSA
jgi:hypothetical protein